MKYQIELATLAQLRAMTNKKLEAYCELTGWKDEQAIDELNDRRTEAQFDEEFEGHDDTPCLENCDDWGTGEGRWHGRM